MKAKLPKPIDLDDFLTSCGLADQFIDIHIYQQSDFGLSIAYQLDLRFPTDADEVYDFGHSVTDFETYFEAREVASKMKALFVCKDFGLDQNDLRKVIGKDTDSVDCTIDHRFDWRLWAMHKIQAAGLTNAAA